MREYQRVLQGWIYEGVLESTTGVDLRGSISEYHRGGYTRDKNIEGITHHMLINFITDDRNFMFITHIYYLLYMFQTEHTTTWIRWTVNDNSSSLIINL